MRKQQAGFTLVEIAIVLVIIGLLLGGVLKGQELINSAKVKNIANDFRTIPLFIYGYQDKFKRLPGDDNGVTGAAGGRFGTSGTPATGPASHKLGNGIIEGTWSSTDVKDESVLFWQHVRLAGLASGSTDFSDSAKASLPANAEGGQIGIQMTTPILDLSGTYYLCSTGINSKLAQQLDTTMDDGFPDKGTMRAQEGSTTAAATGGATSYADGKSYTVCVAF
jgi:prepilin-type N-terminal cleavage/methylation domain-containing protein